MGTIPNSTSPYDTREYYWKGGGHTGSTATSWDYKENWVVAVAGQTGPDGSGYTGNGFYFSDATRTPHGGDNVYLIYHAADSTIGLGVTLPQNQLVSGGWNGSTWTGSTGYAGGFGSGAPDGVTSAPLHLFQVGKGYQHPVGVGGDGITITGVIDGSTGTTSGVANSGVYRAGNLNITASDVKLKGASNFPIHLKSSSLGSVLAEGTAALLIEDSTVDDLEVQRNGVNTTGQNGNLFTNGCTFNSSVNILGESSGGYTRISGFGGSGGFVPAVNVAPFYRNGTVLVDVDVESLAIAPSSKTGTSGSYPTIHDVEIEHRDHGSRRIVRHLQMPASNESIFGTVLGSKTNNPVSVHSGCTIESHDFGSGQLRPGTRIEEDEQVMVIDGTITVNCKLDCTHPSNPRWANFIVGAEHGNTQEGYLVTDQSGRPDFVFARGHFVKADFGRVAGAADGSIILSSGGKG